MTRHNIYMQVGLNCQWDFFYLVTKRKVDHFHDHSFIPYRNRITFYILYSQDSNSLLCLQDNTINKYHWISRFNVLLLFECIFLCNCTIISLSYLINTRLYKGKRTTLSCIVSLLCQKFFQKSNNIILCSLLL